MPKRESFIDISTVDLDNVISDIEEIRKYNPQRGEMEQLTAIVYEDVEKLICVGYKDLAADEFWVAGHMPDVPLMPGVIMCEAAAQIAGYFTKKHGLLGDPEIIGLGSLNDVRFRDPVRPGDRLVLAVQALKLRKPLMVHCQFQGFVEGRLVVEGEIKGVGLSSDAIAGS